MKKDYKNNVYQYYRYKLTLTNCQQEKASKVHTKRKRIFKFYYFNIFRYHSTQLQVQIAINKLDLNKTLKYNDNINVGLQ